MKTLKILKAKYVVLTLFISLFAACDNSDDIENLIDDQKPTEQFDFDNFGKAHNDYLHYVMQTTNNKDPKERFFFGKTYVDPVFGSFDKGFSWEELENQIDFHIRRVAQILEGKYEASTEKLSQEMTAFLNDLARQTKYAVDNQFSLNVFKKMIEGMENDIKRNHEIEIDLDSGISNDGAAMLAICSILKYSTEYWNNASAAGGGGGNGDMILLAKGKIWRALADAWGYVSAWVDNGDGSYSWDHESALVNADCVSDKVREN